MINLHDYSLWTIFSVGLAVILVASEAGRRVGAHAAGEGDSNVSMLAGAMLGLLALIIGFTFSMTLSRFEARRDAVLIEANAIGTAALRARLLPEPYRTEAVKLYRDYVQIRLDLPKNMSTLAEFATALNRSNALQETLWQQAKVVASKNPSAVPTGLYIQALNDMIDAQGKRLSAVRNRMPAIVLLALFGIAAAASGFTGYASGIDARGLRWPVIIVGFLVSAVILLILDLDRPTAGFIQVSQQPMIDTAASIAAFSD